MQRFVTRAVALAGAVAMLALPLASSAAAPLTTAFNPGDLIKGKSTPTVYYYAPNGKRYVFPNEKTYFTWYKDFTKVVSIPDNQLSSIPLGGNVTYRPGYKMVKITTDPRTYVVDQGGVLRHITSEQLAMTLYNLNWKNQVDDVPDAFFTNYRIGTAIQTASDYNPANVMTQTVNISQDKQFDETKVTISISTVTAGFVPTTIGIKRGVEVTWTNRDIVAHSIVGNGWQSGPIQPDATYVKVFSTPGSYDYHDGTYPVMQGTINVL